MLESPSDLRRYGDGTRMNHWIVALLFFAAALSGLAFFHPSLWFLTNLFGGGPWTRILHPYFGLATFVFFVFLAARVIRDNAWNASDSEWLRQSRQMVGGRKENLPRVGKYNGGQKIVFWVMLISLVVLLATGILFWQAWFPDWPIEARRIGVLLHALAAVLVVLSVIVHVYAAIWVKGTLRAMTRGTVTRGWARLNHPAWYDEVVARRDS